MRKRFILFIFALLSLTQFVSGKDEQVLSSEITSFEQQTIDRFIRAEWEEELHLIRVNANNMYLDAHPEDIDYSNSYRIWIFDRSLDDFEGHISQYAFAKSEIWIDTGHSVYLTFENTNGELIPGAVYGTRPTTPVIRVEEIRKFLNETLGQGHYQYCFVMMEPVLMKIALVLDDQGNEWVYPYSKMLTEYGLPENALISSQEFIEKTTSYWRMIHEQQQPSGDPSAGGPFFGMNTWYSGVILPVFLLALCIGVFGILQKKNKRL